MLEVEYIASGFYTSERRVIPLKDKLSTMDADITTIRDLVLGSNINNIEVSIIADDNDYIIKPNQSNDIILSSNINDKIITLSTCNDGSSGRKVVHAKLIKTYL